MAEQSFTLATTTLGTNLCKQLRYIYLDFLLKDDYNNSKLLEAKTPIIVNVSVDEKEPVEYSFIPYALGYQKKKIPIASNQEGIWFTISVKTEYDILIESGECLPITVRRAY